MEVEKKIRIAIIGGGPAGLFMLKHLVNLQQEAIAITIFEKKQDFGAGMPYSEEGASCEHVTNISGNEIPGLTREIKSWVNTANKSLLQKFNINAETFNDYKVLPRLFFGAYLSSQFKSFLHKASGKGIKVELKSNTRIIDVKYDAGNGVVEICDDNNNAWNFDIAIMCMGHVWQTTNEGKINGWYDSPYPPSKLAQVANYPVAIRGASLTAIDAIKTLAHANGQFHKNEDHSLTYTLNRGSEKFRLVLHSLHGLLPAIRFHLEEPKLKSESLDVNEMRSVMEVNDGFVPLDYIFDKGFKQPLKEVNPELFDVIKTMNVEEFVAHVLSLRESINAFDLFKAEYREAEKSIRRRKPVYWKELLAELSYSLNYPAKHFSAEDMLRLKNSLMPLISIIIAFVPQSSCRELLALYDAGVLDLVPVESNSEVFPAKDGSGIIYSVMNEEGQKQESLYKMFIDAIGQKPVDYADFPFTGLKKSGSVSEAFLKFRDKAKGKQHFENNSAGILRVEPDHYYLRVPGVNINDHFQLLDQYNAGNTSLYIMAVPYIAGLNPDYSGLDFCETAGSRIAAAIGNS